MPPQGPLWRRGTTRAFYRLRSQLLLSGSSVLWLKEGFPEALLGLALIAAHVDSSRAEEAVGVAVWKVIGRIGRAVVLNQTLKGTSMCVCERDRERKRDGNEGTSFDWAQG